MTKPDYFLNINPKNSSREYLAPEDEVEENSKYDPSKQRKHFLSE
jgi:hypothetical protein